MEALAVRVLGGQRFQLAHELPVAAELEIELDPPLQHGQPQLGEPLDLARRRAVEQHVGERRAAEQRQRLAQDAGRRVGRQVASAFDERLEAFEVQRARLQPHRVALRAA